MSKKRTSEYSPTQARIMEILKDGLPKKSRELRTALSDDMAVANTLLKHLSDIRKIIRPKGEDILCEIYNRTAHYRHVKLLNGVQQYLDSIARENGQST